MAGVEQDDFLAPFPPKPVWNCDSVKMKFNFLSLEQS